MFELTINYLAVLVAAVAHMVVGMLWFGPIFGKQWMKLSGFSAKSMKKMNMSPQQAMLVAFVCALFTASILSLFINALRINSFRDAAQFSALVWLAFLVPSELGVWLWQGKPFKLFVLQAGHWLVLLLVMSGILTAWR